MEDYQIFGGPGHSAFEISIGRHTIIQKQLSEGSHLNESARSQFMILDRLIKLLKAFLKEYVAPSAGFSSASTDHQSRDLACQNSEVEIFTGLTRSAQVLSWNPCVV